MLIGEKKFLFRGKTGSAMIENPREHGADIVIPVHNQYSCTRNLLESIYRHTDVPFHIFLIDNSSSDETVDLHKVFTRNITVVRNRKNRGWCGGINQGIPLGNRPNVVLMSNGLEVSKGWLGNMVAFLDTHPRIGAVGPMNSNPSDWQCVERVREKLVPQIPRFFTDDLHERNRILSYHFHHAGILIESRLAFFCATLKRRTMEEVGLLDESCIGDEVGEDYCRRLRQAGFVLGLSLDTYVVRRSADLDLTFAASSEGKRLHTRKLANTR
jgi:GT2 family glycosyltransferase